MPGVANRRPPPAYTSLSSFRHKSTMGSILEDFLQETGLEPNSWGRRGQWEAHGRRKMSPYLTTPTWWESPWHGAPPSMHQPGRAGPEPHPSCPWQGPVASVHLMKPSGCDTISSKLGREPLPGSSKGKRERSDK